MRFKEIFLNEKMQYFQDRSYRSKSSRRSDKRRSSGGGHNPSDSMPDEPDTNSGGPPEIRSARLAKSPLLSDRSSSLGAAAICAGDVLEGQNGEANRTLPDHRRGSSPDKVSRDSGVPSPSDDGGGSLVTTEDDSEPIAGMGMVPATAATSFDSDVGAAAATYSTNQNAAAAGVAFASSTHAETVNSASVNSARTVKVTTALAAANQLTVRSVADSPAANRLLQQLPPSSGGVSRLNGPLPVKAELVTNELEPGLSGRELLSVAEPEQS
jgi:hypothetical protein